MDVTWVTERIGVGGGIWTEEKMIEAVRQGITHVVNMQIEWDDRPLAGPYGVEVEWCATDDDFTPKPKELFDKGVDFAQDALARPDTKVFIHCAAGVHRAPMMTLALLLARGWETEDAMRLIGELRPVVDWAPVYVNSVEEWWEQRQGAVGSRQ
jgi:protein-tyrosine phosphatase